MKKNNLNFAKGALTYFSVLCTSFIMLTSCENSPENTPVNKQNNPPAPPPAVESTNSSLDNTFTATEAAAPTSVSASQSSLKVSGTTQYINFSDPTSCQWNPNICNNSFVVWPGYIQTMGNSEFGYGWMSYGPGKGFIPYGTGDHFHIVGMFDPSVEPNPSASSMFGKDWFAFYMQRSGKGRINFDLTQITVRGTVPITLWFKTSTNSWKYWKSLAPGKWNLPGATNIQELHIRAASAVSTDNYSIDNILVKGL